MAKAEKRNFRTSQGLVTEELAREIIGSIADPLVVQDPEWRFTLVNPAAARVFKASGHDAAALIGRNVWEVFTELVGTDFEREMRRAMRDRVPLTFESFYAERGEWSQLRCHPLPDGSLATQWRDVTERRKAEEAAKYLAHASQILGESLDYEKTLAELARVVVPELADWCAIDTRTPQGKVKRVAVAHRDPAMVALARDLETKYPTDLDAPTGVGHILRPDNTSSIRRFPRNCCYAAHAMQSTCASS